MAAARDEDSGGLRGPGLTRWRGLVGALLIVVACLIVFWPPLDADPLWDDNETLHDNPALGSWSGLVRIWLEPGATFQYYPVTYTSFWLEHALFGEGSWPYRMVGVLIHALGALGLWRVLRRLGLPGAFVAALIWALHPMQVESVAWIAERKNVLSGALSWWGLFWGLAYLGVEAGRAECEPEGSARRAFADPRLYAWAALFLAALLAKVSVIVLPFALVVVAWGAGWKPERGRLFALTLVLGAAVLVATIPARLEAGMIATSPLFEPLEPAERVAWSALGPWVYAARALLPVTLLYVYPRWELALLDWPVLAALAGHAAALGLFVVLARRGARLPLAGWIVYGILLAPSLGLLNVHYQQFASTADRYAYLPLASLAAALAAGGSALLRRVPRHARAAGIAASLLVLAPLAEKSWQRVRLFADEGALCLQTLRHNPEAWIARTHYGLALVREGDLERGLAALSRAEREAPESDLVLHRLGWALLQAGRAGEAVEVLERAARANPHNSPARADLGNALAAAGRHERARQTWQALLEGGPGDVPLLVNLGNLDYALGRLDAAEATFRDALARSDASAGAWNGLGALLLRKGRAEEAIAAFGRARALVPSEADYASNEGLAFEAAGRDREALRAQGDALRLAPGHPEACRAAARLLPRARDPESAAELRRACQGAR